MVCREGAEATKAQLVGETQNQVFWIEKMNFEKSFDLMTAKGLKKVQKKFEAIPIHLTLYFHKIAFQLQFFLRRLLGGR